MFGVGRFRLGSALAVAVSVCLLMVRIVLVRGFNDHPRLYPQAHAVALRQSDPVAPDSGWLIFATTDRDTQVRTHHARLLAEVPEGAASRSPAPAGDYLELRAVGRSEGEAVLMLGSLPAATCAAIDHVAASFDGRPPERLATEPIAGDVRCSVKIAGFDRFVQGLLNAQTLVVTTPLPGSALRDVSFQVAGLTWESE